MAASRSFVVFGGSNDRAVLAFLRALEACGQTPRIIARTRSDQLLRTRHARHVAWIRDTPELDLDIFSRCIDAARSAGGSRELVVLPSSEYFNAFLLRHRSTIEAMGCVIPLPDAGIYAALTNKQSAAALFASQGFALPAEIASPSHASLPLVAKPKRNFGPSGGSLYPRLLSTPAELDAFLAEPEASEFFFQEHVFGQSHYLLFHISRSGGHTAWSQRNLLQQPGGKSMLWAERSSFHDTELAARSIDFLRGIGFTGLGMIEVICDANRTAFIEMNPRIWGPIQFCQDQNVPILPAFIGESLHGDPLRFLERRRSPRSRGQWYFWLGGLAETLAAGKRPTWHTSPVPLPRLLVRGLRSDVYLRRDSWRCFLHELSNSAYRSLRGERPQT